MTRLKTQDITFELFLHSLEKKYLHFDTLNSVDSES